MTEQAELGQDIADINRRLDRLTRWLAWQAS